MKNKMISLAAACVVTGLQYAGATSVAPQVMKAVKVENVEKELTINSIKDAIKYAIVVHPQVKKGLNAEMAAYEELRVAKGGYYPDVNLRIASGREQSQTTSIENEGDYRRVLTRSEQTVTLRQMLFDGFEVASRVKRQEAIYKSTAFNTNDNMRALSLRVAESYLEVLRVREQVELAQSNVDAHQEILDNVNKRLKKGLARKADAIQVKGRLSLAKAQLRRQQASIKAIEERYKEAVGRLPEKNLTAPSNLTAKLPKTLEEAKGIVLAEHPALHSNKSSINALAAGIKEAKAKYYPKFNLELTGNENDNLSGARGLSEHYSAMVTMDMNLFRGGQDRAAIASQRYQKAQKMEEKLELELSLVRDLSVAWYARDGKLVELEYFIQHMISSDKTLKAYETQYDMGQRTLFDLLNARSEFFRSKATVVDTKYANLLSSYQLMANMGTLLQELEIK